ncbi:MAG: hypothetical protein AB1390_10895 [Nitrospirota bacterium]
MNPDRTLNGKALNEMERNILRIFLKVRENFDEVKSKVSLVRPYLELMVISTAWALKIEEFEKVLGFKPEFLYKGEEETYAIAALYRVDDDFTTGAVAYEFAEIMGKEKGITDPESIDSICVEKTFGEELLYMLENDILSGTQERDFLSCQNLEKRAESLKKLLERKNQK